MAEMAVDDLVLGLQHVIDRVVRRLRLGATPAAKGRRLLIVQIDGLSRAVLDLALSQGRVPHLARLIQKGGYRLQDMSVGMPTSTPAFQLAAMYGVHPDIPGFHYHDKRSRTDVYFPRGGDAARVEAQQAGDRVGIVDQGSAYGCVFTGGALNNAFNFATLKRPTGTGIVQAVSAFVVVGWVMVKSTVRSIIELTHAVLRLIADPVGESTRGWKWLLLKIGVSIWLRQLFTLAVSRDLYAGVPAIYVNYLDYDVFAHSYGPRHPRALRALARVDRSLRQLGEILRRVPEYGYEVYVLSDHGQAATVPYSRVRAGKRLERELFDEYLLPAHQHESACCPPFAPRRSRLASGIDAYHDAAPAVWQRFVNYLEDDFPWVLGEVRQAREHGGVRVVVAGPNAFVYFLDTAAPLTLEGVDERAPSLADDISRGPGIGFVLARSADGPVCVWRGKRYRLRAEEAGPFAGRPDLGLVLDGIRDLMAMRSAGDLVIYGNGSPDGDVSFIPEHGAHAGPSADELHTFIITPPGARLPSPLTHPTQLYGHFIAAREVTGPA